MSVMRFSALTRGSSLSAWTVARAAIEMYLLKLEKMAHSISLKGLASPTTHQLTDVKGVKVDLGSLLGGHGLHKKRSINLIFPCGDLHPSLECAQSPKTHLNLHSPANVPALLNGLVQIPLGEIRVLTASDGSLVHVEVLDGLVQKPVVLLNCTRKIGISNDNPDKMGCTVQ